MAAAEVDVLVVGAGPAGAVAAAMLARAGFGVLLVDPAKRRRVGRYDVLVSAPALAGLAAAGIAGLDSATPIAAIELRFGPASRRTIAGTGGVVCDRERLGRELRRAATAGGARLVRGSAHSITRDGDRYRVAVDTAQAPLAVTARHVVLATGSASSGGLAPDVQPHALALACAQRFSGATVGHATLSLAAPPASALDQRPACAWVLPAGDGTITVGTVQMTTGQMTTGQMNSDQTKAGQITTGVSPAEQMGEALARLADADDRFAAIRAAGPLTAGQLNTGFAPARVAQAECLLAGDAAGLVNPFTGEGLSYAVQSALLAARAIAAHPADADAARRMYARRLAATFVGYFETARHASRRYQLAWRILAAGADSDHPFFVKGRHALLLPEGFSGLTAADRMDLADSDAPLIVPFLAACDEVAITTVRGEWPFLARLAIAGEALGHHRLRVAVPFYAALMADGTRPDIRRATPAAAIELALLGALAVLGPAPPPAAGRGVDWALTATVLAADFLLAQAARLIAESAPEVSWSFADWLTELTVLRSKRLAPAPQVPAGEVYAALFEFPARIGAQLGGAGPETVRALRDFGYHCGYAFGYAEDVLALRGERTRLDTTLAVMLDGGFSCLPDCLPEPPGAGPLAAGPLAAGALAAAADLRHRALAAAVDGCEAALRSAVTAASAVPDQVAARVLCRFAAALAAPAGAAAAAASGPGPEVAAAARQRTGSQPTVPLDLMGASR